MICIEDYGHLLPATAGKVIGIASFKGEFILVACEHGLFRLCDDGYALRSTRVEPRAPSDDPTGDGRPGVHTFACHKRECKGECMGVPTKVTP